MALRRRLEHGAVADPLNPHPGITIKARGLFWIRRYIDYEFTDYELDILNNSYRITVENGKFTLPSGESFVLKTFLDDYPDHPATRYVSAIAADGAFAIGSGDAYQAATGITNSYKDGYYWFSDENTLVCTLRLRMKMLQWMNPASPNIDKLTAGIPVPRHSPRPGRPSFIWFVHWDPTCLWGYNEWTHVKHENNGIKHNPYGPAVLRGEDIEEYWFDGKRISSSHITNAAENTKG